MGLSERSRECGAIMAELAVLLPLLLLVMLATFDLGRLIYTNQIVSDLTREAAMLVSRGASSQQAFEATFDADAPLDLRANGGIIITRIRRHSIDDPRPWVVAQERAGTLGDYTSHVGVPGQPAVIPQVTELVPGVTIMAVELVHTFEPVFGIGALGADLYPDLVYDAAYF